MLTKPLLLRFFPFLAWFPINSIILRGDLIAGVTGALVLVPKAMAYAQLAGLPVYFGLYTAFVPAILGILWGSSRQLATGPVAIVSLMTAAAVAPLAAPMSDQFVGLVLLLTLMVGFIQFGLGALSLGTIVNFVSHPVILGFMNAAAIIIALSQVDMLLGIPKGRSDSFLKDIWEMFGHFPLTHLPTLAMSVFALVLMLVLKKISFLSKPSVLIAVVVTTLISYSVGYEHQSKSTPGEIADPGVQALVSSYIQTDAQITALNNVITTRSAALRAADKEHKERTSVNLSHQIDLLRIELTSSEKQNIERMRQLRRVYFERTKVPENEPATLYLTEHVPADVETDGRHWHIKKIEKGELKIVGGGDVIGLVPAGLPSFRIPTLSLDAILSLLSAALIISLVAFMESISMAKAMAAQSKQRIDPNQELIGQGLSNIGGAFFQAYPACGSFTGSAINLQAGAKTGFAMVFNGLFVAVTLLVLTPLLYHLPKAVLAVIILLAVAGLITPAALKHTWQASRYDGVTALITFIATLIFAPHLDKGIMIGATLAIVIHLYRTMSPRVAILGRFRDGTLRDASVNNLPPSDVVTAVRFDGRLYFANVSYFEDAILEAVAANPDAPYLLIVGDAINDIDASGEEVIHHLVDRLNEGGTYVMFAGLKKQVLDVLRSTGLWEKIGAEHFFATADEALANIYARPEYVDKDDPFKVSPRTNVPATQLQG
ncbi:MAG: SulP family inorganic anion transporter [Gammaproteobacteria bacterium]|nr:SulP family inorganic anion transporter [Rhodocyclaceae bacterium]MBU3908397.1 SulP family inorganic anion transporter [Gammaproteobacteria bacterium]MBU3988535.1 SulP family inorganic anion transporter [Gammaproteobacteria bacterium]MBU4004107.1 SulP family inorganic anion transporter [Gammaproteobacteria bacterium]MBU4020354.1 SulP family inorganic anion transporter [Gammaproteobacteria bacterium]